MTKVKAVIGANYGDEGKGLATSYFAGKAEGNVVVVLTNGGAQRGHTVETEHCRHIFHHFGSHLPMASVSTFIPSQFCVNPIEFIRERNEMISHGWTGFVVYVSPDCRVTTPYDIFLNQILEMNRGKNRHGSTGMGIWTTITRDKEIKLSFRDLNDVILSDKLDSIRDYSVAATKGLTVPDEYVKLFESEGLKKHFIEDCHDMRKKTKMAENSVLSTFDEVIFENGQGLLLSYEEGNMHTTPSFTGMENINDIAKDIKDISETEICYVTRTYLTRHGAGPFPTECQKPKMVNDDATNIYNPWQESIRYGELITRELNERIAKDFYKCKLPNAKKTVMVTHLNEMSAKMSEINGVKYLSPSKYAVKILKAKDN